jgi:transcriptional regulator with XRE-family HTH domain
MNAASIIREARKRARLSQRELAELLGTTQSAIARWEAGASSPSFDRLRDVVRACGFELSVRIVSPDTEHSLLIEENLRLTPRRRLERMAEGRAGIEQLLATTKRPK